jgi:hypothetical protein
MWYRLQYYFQQRTHLQQRGTIIIQELERVNRMLYSFSLFFSVPPRTLRDITSVMLRHFPFTLSAVRYSNFVKIFQKSRSHLRILDAAGWHSARSILTNQKHYATTVRNYSPRVSGTRNLSTPALLTDCPTLRHYTVRHGQRRWSKCCPLTFCLFFLPLFCVHILSHFVIQNVFLQYSLCMSCLSQPNHLPFS